ncbi:MAG: hydrophobic compound transporter HcuC [Alphaproteobacteria bacterium]
MRKLTTLAPADAAPQSNSLAPLRALLPFLYPYRWHLAGAMLALLIAAGTVLGLGHGLRLLVDHGLAEGDAAFLDTALFILLAIIGGLAAATFARFYLITWTEERVVADLRKAVFARMIALEPAFFELNRTGELISRITADTSVLQSVAGSSLSIALRNIVLLLGGSALLVHTSPQLAGLMLLVVPLVVVPIVVYGRRVRRLSAESQDRLGEVGSVMDESLHGIRIVQAFTREAETRGRFDGAVEATFSAAHARIRARAWMTALVILLAFGAIAMVLWKGGHDVLAGRMSGGDLSAFIFYGILVSGAVGALSEVMGQLLRAAGATERLISLLHTEPGITAPDSPAPMPSPLSGRLTFDSVRFSYPTRPDQPALDNLSLTIEAGETVALVGPSGGGKSTILQLLLRFYDPQSGTVSLDGTEIAATDPQQMRQHLALVPQEPILFGGTVAENLRFGKTDATEDELWSALNAAHAEDFVRALPDQLETQLGDRGITLSGGQRQRIAIARAILKDAPVLLLDEATSALDAESEGAVQAALETLMQGRTTLVIAHRLATIREADRIAVIDQGRVAATGTHDQLIAQDGLYARLARLQFQDERRAS